MEKSEVQKSVQEIIGDYKGIQNAPFPLQRNMLKELQKRAAKLYPLLDYGLVKAIVEAAQTASKLHIKQEALERKADAERERVAKARK